MEPQEEKIVVIARHPNNRALLLQSRLAAEGIECFLSHENLLQGAVSSGVEIKVKKSDVEKALRLIEQSKAEHGEQKEAAVKALRSVRRILVPVDFSDASNKACSFALGLAAKLKAEVKLLHVYYNPVIDIAPFDTSHAYQVNLINYLHEAEQNARHQLINLAKDLKAQVKKKKQDIKITYSLTNGLAADEIIDKSRKYKPGLIVIGTRGIGKQTGGFLGSVTARVIEKTSAPVLAIPESSRFTKVENMKNVLYATDFDQSDHLSISRLIGLLHPFDTNLYCVHISIGMRKSWEKVKMETLKHFITKEYKKFPIQYDMVVSDDILNGLETYMRNHSIDVIALTNHNRSLLARLFTPSITKLILGRISKPLFVFKSVD
ncbi:MAG TPA: universal stress protein [Lentimicrobium sp.]|jgi:nucleotide-binding universal stress UspA family protein|nr:universal stress protein [Lentimicrobium sp.]